MRTPDKNSYIGQDHARTHGQLIPSADRNTPAIEQDFNTLMKHGYVVIENLLSDKQLDGIRSAGLAFMQHKGRNNFEGFKTQRVYDVLSKTRTTDRLADHPRILGLMDRLFRPGFLLSQSQMINILPGEAAQALHTDDDFCYIPRPRQPLGAATVWAIDDFTRDNGATVVIPDSHTWGDEQRGHTADAVPVVMPAGSVVFFLGTTWHGGGANKSRQARLAVTHQYCEAYMRQQENYLLELSKDTVRALSPELKALVGYSIYPPFIGMVNGAHPLRTLEH